MWNIELDVYICCASDSGLYIVGSSMSGFATRTSDMDLCLMITEQQVHTHCSMSSITIMK